jgi:adenylate kinase
LVPDAVTIGLVREVLQNLQGRGFILDGFPRTVVQATALEDLTKELDLKIEKTVFLEVPQQMLLGRLTGRRVCTNCGATYHVTAKPPKKDGACDVCGGAVIQRPDDKEEVIRTRLEAYENSTRPLKDYYKAKGGPYVEIDGTGSSEDVFQRVAKALGKSSTDI